LDGDIFVVETSLDDREVDVAADLVAAAFDRQERAVVLCRDELWPSNGQMEDPA
jgi:hypothetical protein